MHNRVLRVAFKSSQKKSLFSRSFALLPDRQLLARLLFIYPCKVQLLDFVSCAIFKLYNFFFASICRSFKVKIKKKKKKKNNWLKIDEMRFEYFKRVLQSETRPWLTFVIEASRANFLTVLFRTSNSAIYLMKSIAEGCNILFYSAADTF